MSYLKNLEFMFASPIFGSDLVNLGLTFHTTFHWRYHEDDRDEVYIISRAMDYDGLYADVQNDLPESVRSGYRYVPAYQVGDMIRSIPGIILRNTANSYTVSSTVQPFRNILSNSEVLSESLALFLREVLTRGVLHPDAINDYFISNLK